MPLFEYAILRNRCRRKSAYRLICVGEQSEQSTCFMNALPNQLAVNIIQDAALIFRLFRTLRVENWPTYVFFSGSDFPNASYTICIVTELTSMEIKLRLCLSLCFGNSVQCDVMHTHTHKYVCIWRRSVV